MPEIEVLRHADKAAKKNEDVFDSLTSELFADSYNSIARPSNSEILPKVEFSGPKLQRAADQEKASLISETKKLEPDINKMQLLLGQHYDKQVNVYSDQDGLLQLGGPTFIVGGNAKPLGEEQQAHIDKTLKRLDELGSGSNQCADREKEQSAKVHREFGKRGIADESMQEFAYLRLLSGTSLFARPAYVEALVRSSKDSDRVKAVDVLIDHVNKQDGLKADDELKHLVKITGADKSEKFLSSIERKFGKKEADSYRRNLPKLEVSGLQVIGKDDQIVNVTAGTIKAAHTIAKGEIPIVPLLQVSGHAVNDKVGAAAQLAAQALEGPAQIPTIPIVAFSELIKELEQMSEATSHSRRMAAAIANNPEWIKQLKTEAEKHGLEAPTPALINQAMFSMTHKYVLEKQKFDNAPGGAFTRWCLDKIGVDAPEPQAPKFTPQTLISEMTRKEGEPYDERFHLQSLRLSKRSSK